MDSSTSHVVKSALAPLELPDLSLAELILSQVERLGERAALVEAATGRARHSIRRSRPGSACSRAWCTARSRCC